MAWEDPNDLFFWSPTVNLDRNELMTINQTIVRSTKLGKSIIWHSPAQGVAVFSEVDCCVIHFHQHFSAASILCPVSEGVISRFFSFLYGDGPPKAQPLHFSYPIFEGKVCLSYKFDRKWKTFQISSQVLLFSVCCVCLGYFKWPF